ncbi:hypothetical protein PSOLE_03470 [Pseudomonas oleovorans subsp. oleovorans]|nr:hypothetical protein PSOLE_03470 [Pseudomonas oleovorans subsp. oleovorans]
MLLRLGAITTDGYPWVRRLSPIPMSLKNRCAVTHHCAEQDNRLVGYAAHCNGGDRTFAGLAPLTHPTEGYEGA